MNTKSATVKNSAIGAWPDFITKNDLEEALFIEREATRLVAQRQRVTRDLIKAAFNRASAAYSQNPTDENFAAVKELATELTLVEDDNNYYGRLRTLVHESVRDSLIKARFLPWARAIIERGLTAARASLADVVTAEEQHHMDVLGEPLGQRPNAIVEKASRPVRELERILASLNEQDVTANESGISVFVKFLRERAASARIVSD